MGATLDDQARAAALAFARGLAAWCDIAFGPRLLGAYLIGSLAHGSFGRRYSDIDFGLVTESGLDTADISALRAAAAALSPELAGKLSLFWTDRTFTLGRFPPLDRVDYCDFALALLERERVVPPRPTRDDIRTYLRGAPMQSWKDNVRRCIALTAFEPKDHKLIVRMHLYPARYIYGWMTGLMGSNETTVAYVSEHPPTGLDLNLIAQALACRQSAADPHALFAARNALQTQLAACERLFDDSN